MAPIHINTFFDGGNDNEIGDGGGDGDERSDPHVLMLAPHIHT